MSGQNMSSLCPAWRCDAAHHSIYLSARFLCVYPYPSLPFSLFLSRCLSLPLSLSLSLSLTLSISQSPRSRALASELPKYRTDQRHRPRANEQTHQMTGARKGYEYIQKCSRFHRRMRREPHNKCVFLPGLGGHGLGEITSHGDGGTCHCSRASRELPGAPCTSAHLTCKRDPPPSRSILRGIQTKS